MSAQECEARLVMHLCREVGRSEAFVSVAGQTVLGLEEPTIELPRMWAVVAFLALLGSPSELPYLREALGVDLARLVVVALFATELLVSSMQGKARLGMSREIEPMRQESL
jgi:hypothetical protein